MTASPRRDAIVVGAGPAGAATAILLAGEGLSVTVIDRVRSPRTRICGEYLSPEGTRILDRLGALKGLTAAGAPTLAGMRITAPDGRALEARYRAVGAWRPYHDGALGVPRALLDLALCERLRSLPIDFREGVRATDLIVEGSRVAGVLAVDDRGRRHELRAPLTIGADGRASVIAQRLGCRRAHRLRRLALVTYVRGLPDCREVGEIFVDPPDYAILNPVASDRVNVSLVVPLADAAPYSARLETFLAARVRQLPHLARRLDGAERIAPVQAMGPLAYRVIPPRHGGVLLVGDAAGFYDPFTGEGIFSALRSAELAAETVVRALAAGDVSARALRAYQRQRRDAFRDKERLTRAIQFIVRRRWAANLTATFLLRRPDVLDLLLGVVGDYVPPGALLSGLGGRSAPLGR